MQHPAATVAPSSEAHHTWLFGYGSLIWRPDFDYVRRVPARAHGWQRRFWQGSHDHRGTPQAPGRVVTLIPEAQAVCQGMAYQLRAETLDAVLPALDHREKNGYQRLLLDLELAAGEHVVGLTWVASQDNPAWLGPATLDDLVAQILRSSGPSGANPDYVLELAAALRQLDATDPHVFELAEALQQAMHT